MYKYVAAYISAMIRKRSVLMQISPLHLTNLFVLFTCLQFAALGRDRQKCREEVLNAYYTLACQ